MIGTVPHPPATAAEANPQPGLALRESAFRNWLRTARPGSLIEYHRGLLSVDRLQKPHTPNNEARAELHRLATRAMRASEQGFVRLVQKHHGPEDFIYLAIKVRPPAKRRCAAYLPLKLSEKR